MIGYLGAALGFGGAVLAEEAVAALAEEVGCGFLAEAALRVLICYVLHGFFEGETANVSRLRILAEGALLGVRCFSLL